MIPLIKLAAKKTLSLYYRFHCPPLVRRTKLLARPGFMGFDGGIFNPGAISLDREVILLARAERFRIAERRNKSVYLRSCSPLLSRYSEAMVLNESKVLSLEDYPANRHLRYHDFRLFRFKSASFANHTLCDTSTWEDSTFPKWQKIEESVAIAELDLDRCCLKFKGVPQLDFVPRRREKNFAFFEHNGNLHLIYSFFPYILLKEENPEKLHFKTVINRQIKVRSLNTDDGRFISLSTNPIHYDDKHYLVLIHKRDRFCVYSHWGILISKESLLPVKITSRPLFRGETSGGSLTAIVYVMSVLSFGNVFRFFLGEGDLYSTYAEITKGELDKVFVPISDHSSEG